MTQFVSMKTNLNTTILFPLAENEVNLIDELLAKVGNSNLPGTEVLQASIDAAKQLKKNGLLDSFKDENEVEQKMRNDFSEFVKERLDRKNLAIILRGKLAHARSNPAEFQILAGGNNN
jgi:hypothetical protein